MHPLLSSLNRRLPNTLFAGVPDSLMKPLLTSVTANVESSRHVIAANEGAAVALAAGFHLATGKTPVVYLQNSGWGNALNPLLSLSDPRVYALPTVLLVGWRGEPGHKDEPQHVAQGAAQTALLEAADVPYEILPSDEGAADEAVRAALSASLLAVDPREPVVTHPDHRNRRLRA